MCVVISCGTMSWGVEAVQSRSCGVKVSINQNASLFICYESLERFIGISHKHWNHGKIMGDHSAIIPLDIRNGVVLTSKG